MNNHGHSDPKTAEDFWGELAPPDHAIQIYATDDDFLNSLEVFVRNGLQAGETVIAITTLVHRTALEKRLLAQGINPLAAIVRKQYIPLDVRNCLASFMVDNDVDEERFNTFISGLLARAHERPGPVRAFGEMVAVLWAHGNRDATLKLERCWDKFCNEQAFCLYCAYPQNGFTDDLNGSLTEIRDAHSRVFPVAA